MRLADYVIRFLEAHVDQVFTVVGGGSIFLCDALAQSAKLGYVACHHEQAAAMAAEAYARTRNGLGVALVTSGPGGTNALTGVAGAWTDHVATLTISGQVFLAQTTRARPGLRTLGVQEMNIVALARPVTKYAAMVEQPELIRFHLEKALHEAFAGRRGPVWLDIPADVQNAEIDPDSLAGFLPAAELPGRAAIRREALALQAAALADDLARSPRPLLHIGQGIRLAGAQAELARFLELTRMPVVTARNGNDLIDSGHPLYAGRPGTFAQRGANFAVQTAALYLAVGTRLSLAQTGYNAGDYARNAKVVMVDIERAELEKDTVPLDVKIEADAREFLAALNTALAGVTLPDWSGWLAQCKAWQAKYPAVPAACREQAEFVSSYYFLDVLSDLLGPHDAVVTDMGFAFQNTHQAFRVKAGQRLMTNCGLAAMGWGLPAAIGACFARGRRRTVAIVGDGGLMMNLQELATLAHHRLPVKLFVLNNGGYLTMRQSQAHAFERYMGSDQGSGLSFPDFELLAGAFGIAHAYCTGHEGLAYRLASALEADGPVLVEILMDPDQETAPKSINRRLPDGTIKQTAIEDAYPFLDPAEVEEQMRVAG